MEKIKTRERFAIHSSHREEEIMKQAMSLPVLILLLSCNLASAKKIPPRPFLLQDTVSVNGAQVPAGVYELTWESQGSSAHVALSKNGKFVAAAQGVWVKSGAKYKEDAALLRVNSDGSKSLVEIRIAGGTKSIVFEHTDVVVHYTALRP
jgi:hypothetical protein